MASPPPTPVTDPLNPKIQRWESIGLTLIHDFISEAEEAAMIQAFHARDPKMDGKRRISQHYGFHFDYTTFGVSDAHFTPVPSYITDFLPRLPVQDYLPDQFTIQYYPPGAGIPPHVDTHSMFGEALYSLSFGSGVPMQFRMSNANDARKMRLPKRSLQTSEVENNSSPASAASTAVQCNPDTSSSEKEEEPWELMLPPRSLLLMTGPSRYGYTHGIKGRKTDIVNGEKTLRKGRYSITMRSIRRGDEIRCDCEYPGVCDARIREEQAAAGGGASQ